MRIWISKQTSFYQPYRVAPSKERKENAMKTAFIFTFGNQYQAGFRWYVDYYDTIEEAKENCEPGWAVTRYCDFSWKY